MYFRRLGKESALQVLKEFSVGSIAISFARSEKQGIQKLRNAIRKTLEAIIKARQ